MVVVPKFYLWIHSKYSRLVCFNPPLPLHLGKCGSNWLSLLLVRMNINHIDYSSSIFNEIFEIHLGTTITKVALLLLFSVVAAPPPGLPALPHCQSLLEELLLSATAAAAAPERLWCFALCDLHCHRQSLENLFESLHQIISQILLSWSLQSDISKLKKYQRV